MAAGNPVGFPCGWSEPAAKGIDGRIGRQGQLMLEFRGRDSWRQHPGGDGLEDAGSLAGAVG